MFDSLAYRNDAAIVMRRLIRSMPTASGVMVDQILTAAAVENAMLVHAFGGSTNLLLHIRAMAAAAGLKPAAVEELSRLLLERISIFFRVFHSERRTTFVDLPAGTRR
jgi:dihydroxyacid dehydratase/phosphogluconate dehydratase